MRGKRMRFSVEGLDFSGVGIYDDIIYNYMMG